MYYAERRRRRRCQRARNGSGPGRERPSSRPPLRRERSTSKPPLRRVRLKLLLKEEESDEESFGSLSSSELESMLDYDGEFEVYEDESEPVRHTLVERKKAKDS